MQQNSGCTCCERSTEQKFAMLQEVIVEHNRQESNLIQVLHMAQAIFGYLPKDVLVYVAKEMNLPLSKVTGVVSFYSLFATKPQGRHILQICLGTACYVQGGKELMARLKDLLKVNAGETTKDGRFTFEVTRCIGACSLAPAIDIDGKVFKHVKLDEVQSILDQYE